MASPFEVIERFYPRAATVLGLPARSGLPEAEVRSCLSVDERRLLDSPDILPTVSLWARRARRFGSAESFEEFSAGPRRRGGDLRLRDRTHDL